MTGNFTTKDILRWTGIILDPDNEIIPGIISQPDQYKKLFIEDLAENLYGEMRRTIKMTEFSLLEPSGRDLWYDYAAGIPAKLQSLGLMIRQASDFYRTCIITDEEIEKLAAIDNDKYSGKKELFFTNIQGQGKSFFRKLNFLIPPQLKKTGFEIIRREEGPPVNPATIRKLARAIHSRYLQEMRNRESGETATVYPGDAGNRYLMDFDQLPDEIKYSNTDSAHHIATKLLAIGYRIKPLQEGFDTFTLHLDDDEIETMAKIEHIRWNWDKRLNGWIYGNVKDNRNKVHPGLIPYEDLSESEKEKDRELVRLIPALLQDIGYTAYPVIPDSIRNLSYAIKPQSIIHKLLNETRKLNGEIRVMSSENPAIEEKVSIINNKIEEIILEVQGNYSYARHIQETFLPEDLFIRECFPDSFVLFRPRDIVSGDFYFFSRQNNKLIFVAADCTGHGIPGALLSTLGYGLIDQAVNEKKLTSPPEILDHLYSKVHKFLRRNEDQGALFDDMDIAVCTFDEKTRILAYAGVTNPVYLIHNGRLTDYPAKNYITNCKDITAYKFESEDIQTVKGDTIYIFSDGYPDQFGGKRHKKYQRGRFRSLLLSIQDLPMAEQRDRLYEEIERWREENDEDQTDDILVIGIKI